MKKSTFLKFAVLSFLVCFLATGLAFAAKGGVKPAVPEAPAAVEVPEVPEVDVAVPGVPAVEVPEVPEVAGAVEAPGAIPGQNRKGRAR